MKTTTASNNRNRAGMAETIIFFLLGGELQTVLSNMASRANVVGRNKCFSYKQLFQQ